VGWIIVLAVVAVPVSVALIEDRRRSRRERFGESPDEWNSERQATGDAAGQAPFTGP
jgi:hypothetical protein